jgi:hypothetical protein
MRAAVKQAVQDANEQEKELHIKVKCKKPKCNFDKTQTGMISCHEMQDDAQTWKTKKVAHLGCYKCPP